MKQLLNAVATLMVFGGVGCLGAADPKFDLGYDDAEILETPQGQVAWIGCYTDKTEHESSCGYTYSGCEDATIESTSNNVQAFLGVDQPGAPVRIAVYGQEMGPGSVTLKVDGKDYDVAVVVSGVRNSYY